MICYSTVWPSYMPADSLLPLILVICHGVVLRLQFGGVSPYMQAVLESEGGYEERMKEKGLNPLCREVLSSSL